MNVSTTIVGNGSVESNVKCGVNRDTADRIVKLLSVIWYVWLALGVSGNVLSAIIWLRRHVVGKSSSAIHLAALAVNDLAYQLSDQLTSYVTSEPWIWLILNYIRGVSMLLEPPLVLGFSVERLLAVVRPLQVCNLADCLRLLKVFTYFFPRRLKF